VSDVDMYDWLGVEPIINAGGKAMRGWRESSPLSRI
jgi:hypothetical protein